MKQIIQSMGANKTEREQLVGQAKLQVEYKGLLKLLTSK